MANHLQNFCGVPVVLKKGSKGDHLSMLFGRTLEHHSEQGHHRAHCEESTAEMSHPQTAERLSPRTGALCVNMWNVMTVTNCKAKSG